MEIGRESKSDDAAIREKQRQANREIAYRRNGNVDSREKDDKRNGIPCSRSSEIIEGSSNGATLADLRSIQSTASLPVNYLYQDELSISRHFISV